MKKEKILDLIKRYYLGGKVEGVVWKTYNNEIHIDFVTIDRTLLGIIKSDNFIGIEDNVELPILNTGMLMRTIEAQEGDIDISITKVDIGSEIKIPYINISSTDELGKRAVNYLLGNESVILRPKKIEENTLPEFILSLDINKKFIDNYVKYKAIWPDAKTITIIKNKETNKYEIYLAYSSVKSTYGSLPVGKYDQVKDLDNPVSFSSDFFKEILVANKNAEKIRFDISQEGLSRVVVNDDKLDITYYLSEIEPDM